MLDIGLRHNIHNLKIQKMKRITFIVIALISFMATLSLNAQNVWVIDYACITPTTVDVTLGYDHLPYPQQGGNNFVQIFYGPKGAPNAWIQFQTLPYIVTGSAGTRVVRVSYLMENTNYEMKPAVTTSEQSFGSLAYFTTCTPPDPCLDFHPSITCGDLSLCEGESTTLTASNGVSYKWDNGATSKSISVNTAGTYVVTVTDLNGCSASAEVIVIMNPKPQFLLSSAQQTLGMKGGYDVITAKMPDPSNFLFMWNTASLEQTIYTAIEGKYSVTVTDEHTWCYSSDTIDIFFSMCPDTIPTPCDTCGNGGTGGNPPVAIFDSHYSGACAPLVVHFSDKSTNFPTSWHWYFPGGEPSESFEKNPVVTYRYKDSYDVSLVATNQYGSSPIETAHQVITVTGEAPTISASASPSEIHLGEYSELSVSVSNPIGNFIYEWSPAGSLNWPNHQSPLATPNVTTPYQVRVLKIGETCPAFDTVVVKVFGTTANHEIDPNILSAYSVLESGNIVIKAAVSEYQVFLFNAEGKLLKVEKCAQNESTISTGDLVPGCYFWYMQSGNRRSLTSKMVVIN